MRASETATQGDRASDGESGGRLTKLDPRALRRADIRIFSSASDAPNARRPTDVILLIVSVVGVVTLSFLAPGPTAIDRTVRDLVQELPGLLGWFWNICYDLLIVWAFVLLILALVARGRKRLFLTELITGALALGLALLAGRVAGTDWSTSLRALEASGSPAVYLAIRLAIATAIVVMASPHMSRPLRFIGRWVVTLGALAGIGLGVTLPIGMVAGLLIGLGSAAIMHLILGSPAGRLTLHQIATALDDLGVEATDLRHAPLEPSGVALVLATSPDGTALLAKVYGRDAWDGQFLASIWSSLWNRGERPSLGVGRLRQVEHEAFVTLLAERAGMPVLPVVAAGMATARDALLVSEISGRPLGSVDPTEVDDELVRAVWRAMGVLHDLGIAHGQLDGERIVVRSDGTPAVGDFGGARVAASDGAMMADLAQVLVTTALVVGPDRAIAAATDVIGKDTFADVLPFVQPAVLDRDTRRAVRDGDWDLDDLMARSTELTGTEAPELEQIRRVTGKSIAIVALIAFVAYGLISTLAHVGLEALWDELKSANLAWMLTALILAPISQVPQAFSTLGASVRDMVFVPVLMLQYAIQFIQLAVPSSAARVALEVRFFQRNGVETGAALSIGLIDGLSRIRHPGPPDPDHHGLGVGEPRSVRRLRLVEQLVLLVGTEPLAPRGGAHPPRRDHRARDPALPSPYQRGDPALPSRHPRTDVRGREGPPGAPFAFEGHDAVPGELRRADDAGDDPRDLPARVRRERFVRGTGPREHDGRAVRGLHAGARRDGRVRGRPHRRTGRARGSQRGGDVDGDRLPIGDVLPTADLGLARHTLAEATSVPVIRGSAGVRTTGP